MNIVLIVVVVFNKRSNEGLFFMCGACIFCYIAIFVRYCVVKILWRGLFPASYISWNKLGN